MGTQKAQHPLINARTLNLTKDHGIDYVYSLIMGCWALCVNKARNPSTKSRFYRVRKGMRNHLPLA